MVVENVRGAQKWVGRAQWNYGSFYLWGDVPALMPMTFKRVMKAGVTHRSDGSTNFHQGRYDGSKVAGFRFDGSGKSFQTASVKAAMKDDESGNKMGGDWFSDPTSTCRRHGSKSKARKAASAMIAKIPFPLAQHIAKVFKTDDSR
jgi:hypothetical protein